MGDVTPDLPIIDYLCTSILGLTILLSASLALVFSIAREFEDRTVKELIMASSFANILGGKLLSAAVQSAIVMLFILAEGRLVFGYLPKNIWGQLFFLFWGVLFSAGLAMIAATKVKQVLPAGIGIMVLNIGSWWLSGGLAPAEVWTGLLRTLADCWPGTYFYQTYINISLLGNVSPALFARNMLITGITGTLLLVAACFVFAREAKRA